jgi:hypothetical protein
MKIITTLVVAAASCGTALAQTPMDARNASVRVDCASFAKTLSGEWVVTKNTTVIPGPNNLTIDRIDLPPGLEFGKNKISLNGADLAEVLDQHCK